LKFYTVTAKPLLLYGSKCRTLTKEHMSRMETAEMRFVITVTGYRRKDHKRDEDIREELGITGISTIMKLSVEMCRTLAKNACKTESQSCCINMNRRVQVARDVSQYDGRNSFNSCIRNRLWKKSVTSI